MTSTTPTSGVLMSFSLNELRLNRPANKYPPPPIYARVENRDR